MQYTPAYIDKNADFEAFARYAAEVDNTLDQARK